MAQHTMGDEENGIFATDESPKDPSGFGGSDGLENGTGTILGPLQNFTRLGMEDGCLVDWTPEKIYHEPNMTYSMSFGCMAGWTSNFKLKTISNWFRENAHEFIVGITIALTLVRNPKITPHIGHAMLLRSAMCCRLNLYPIIRYQLLWHFRFWLVWTLKLGLLEAGS